MLNTTEKDFLDRTKNYFNFSVKENKKIKYIEFKREVCKKHTDLFFKEQHYSKFFKTMIFEFFKSDSKYKKSSIFELKITFNILIYLAIYKFYHEDLYQFFIYKQILSFYPDFYLNRFIKNLSFYKEKRFFTDFYKFLQRKMFFLYKPNKWDPQNHFLSLNQRNLLIKSLSQTLSERILKSSYLSFKHCYNLWEMLFFQLNYLSLGKIAKKYRPRKEKQKYLFSLLQEEYTLQEILIVIHYHYCVSSKSYENEYSFEFENLLQPELVYKSIKLLKINNVL